MDLATILTSVLSSGLVSAGIVYILKKSVDKAIDARFDKWMEQNKALIQEQARRAAFVYDKQFDALKMISSLSYRLRNALRELTSSLKDKNPDKTRELLRRLHAYQDMLIELLFEERLILPSALFDKAHDLKNQFLPIFTEINKWEAKSRGFDIPDEELESIYKKMDSTYTNIDKLHNELVEIAQAKLGMESTQQLTDPID